MAERIAVPTVSTEQMQEIDRLMVEVYTIDLLQMMENAGRSLAMLARTMLGGEVTDRPIVVLAGRGNNGGGGLVAARHLLNWGAWVQIVCSYPPAAYQGAPARQLQILQAMGAPLAWAEEGWELPPADLLIDAIIGYGLRGDPRGPARNLIQLANSSAAPILSLDAPSGVDSAAGRVFAPHIQAAATLTLALPKTGFRQPAAAAACGALHLADIGAPAALYEQLGIAAPLLFGRADLIALAVEDGELWAEA
ncbi:MAG TPA: NAD(P)H-hydrate epimerase [Caldilinea sp.]|nr:NAD(P)H-hydrate epimerase [Anaerolineales bacterium]HRA68065.1 NAD(P)H-hydrate epimerase [Caldilinea sp.]